MCFREHFEIISFNCVRYLCACMWRRGQCCRKMDVCKGEQWNKKGQIASPAINNFYLYSTYLSKDVLSTVLHDNDKQ